MSEQILIKDEQDTFFEQDGESEILNILNGISQLGYRNDNVLEVLHRHLVGPDFENSGEISGQYDLYSLYNIVTSFARIAPDQTHYLKDFVPQLHKLLVRVGETQAEVYK